MKTTKSLQKHYDFLTIGEIRRSNGEAISIASPEMSSARRSAQLNSEYVAGGEIVFATVINVVETVDLMELIFSPTTWLGYGAGFLVSFKTERLSHSPAMSWPRQR